MKYKLLSLFACINLLSGCSQWAEPGQGGMAEHNLSELIPVEAEQPLTADHGLRFDFELQRQLLDTLVNQGAQLCYPATVSQLQQRENRIARELKAGMSQDAANTLLIQRQQTAQLERQLNQALAESDCVISQRAHQTATQVGMTIEQLLNADNQFALNSSELNPKYIGRLAEAVALLKQQEHYRLMIYGHADSSGSEQANMALSQARAEQVSRYLAILGLDPTRFDVAAMGESAPLFEQEGSENQLVNRRVSITLIENAHQEQPQ
ncbi:OmpA family protein [Motilimonas sp. KMU-193]|uniref:OmpA family protein n=1 Tax=Motilimonas sp. KMU-193 TaxID=3388668 RepID=UPI00396B2A1C